jgi:hypothetical protein
MIPIPGLNPTTPQQAAGRRTDPPVSVPIAISTSPAATAAADPLDEPPTMRPGHCGLTGVPPRGSPGHAKGQFMHGQLAQQPPFTHRQQIGNQPGMARRGAASAKTALP